MKILLKLNSEFGKNVLTLFTGATIAQVIPFIVSPILTRLYSPEDFGLLALFTSVFSLFSIIVTLQYETAIVLPSENYKAANLVGLCLVLTLGITLFSAIVVIVFNTTIADLIGDIRISFWLYFVPIPIFLTGIYNTFNYWATRQKQYKRLALRTISQSFSTAIAKLILGVVGFVKGGLISGTIIGLLTSTTVLSWFTWKEDKKQLLKINKTDIIKVAKEYKNFPKFNALQGFFDIINYSWVSFIISSNFGSSVLGLYSFSYALIQKPIVIIGNSISQVYYQKVSEAYNKKQEIWPLTRKIILRLFIISILIFTPLLLFGTTIFNVFFGNEWELAGKYTQIFIIGIFGRFITSPLASIANVLKKQKELLLIVVFYNLTLPLLFLTLIFFQFQFELCLLIVSVFTFIYYVAVLIWIYKIINNIVYHD